MRVERAGQGEMGGLRDGSAGFIATVPLLAGMVPWGLALGAIAQDTGLGVVGALAMSTIVLAGASQFVALALMQAGAGGLEVVASTALVNSRFVLFSVALLPMLQHLSLGQRALAAHGLTDPAYVITMARDRASYAYLMGSETAVAVAWIGASGAGAALGSQLPPLFMQAAHFSVFAYFIAVVVRAPLTRPRVAACLAAAAIAVTGSFLALRGLEVLLAGVVGASVGMLLERRAA